MTKVDGMPPGDQEAIVALLDLHHQSTAAKKVDTLQAVFHHEGLFIGTDDTERWGIVRLLFEMRESEVGWNLRVLQERHVNPVPCHPDIATFFEVVQNAKYGPWRGSGTVIRGPEGWKIVTYVLSFSIPNDVADNPEFLTHLVRA